jgi:predicted ATPase
VLYNAAEHRPLAARFNVDSRIMILCWRSFAAWVLGYPAAAISDSDQAVGDGRDIGQAASLMYALLLAPFTHNFCGNCATATALINEVTALADEKGSFLTRAIAALVQAEIFALNDNATAALQSNIDGLNAYRSTGQTIFIPVYLSWLAGTYAKLGKFDDAWGCIGEAVTAIKTRKETWCESEVNRVAGEIALRSPPGDLLKAQAYFERALAVARQQQAKSWELRAAMSMARLWRDRGKRDEASELLAPVYGWFTEGFDTLDLKDAKKLLDQLGGDEPVSARSRQAG